MTRTTTMKTLAAAALLGLAGLTGTAMGAEDTTADAAVSPKADTTTPVGERSGEEVFVLFCRACHAPGPQHPATSKLAITKGADKSVILNRADLPAEYIMHVVRNGLLGMPPLRPTDVTEAELERLVQYVRTTPADKIPAEHPGGAYTKAPTLEEIWIFGIKPRLFTVIVPAVVVLVAVIVFLLRRRKR
jgi:mono/diheme cytochrome c family protein